MAVNKVVFKTETLIDLTSDTAIASDVAEGKTFHDASGALVTGTASGGGTYEEEDLSTGGFWAKINYIESYPEVPGALERRQMTPYLESMSGKHCTVYVKNPSTGEWVTQSWNDTKIDQYMDAHYKSNEEFYYRINLKIVPDSGYKIDPTNIPFYNEFVNGNYGSVYAGIYSGYKTDMTGDYTVWGNIIDIDDDGVGYAAVCWPLSYPIQTGQSVDIYCKAIQA